MAELDHGAKLALRIDPQGVISLGLPGAVVSGPLPAEAISAQRTVDASFEATFADGTAGVLHVEFEAQPSSTSGARAARAACALHIATAAGARGRLLPPPVRRRPPAAGPLHAADRRAAAAVHLPGPPAVGGRPG